MSIPAAFAGVVLIWSTTPLAIQWSIQGGGFLFAVTARMALGLVFCLLTLRAMRVAVPMHRRAMVAYVIAGAGIYGSMTLVYWGARFIPSGWIAVLFGLSPLLTSVFAALWLSRKLPDGWESAGLLMGVAGLAVIFGDAAVSGHEVHYGIAAVVASAALHAASAVGVKRYSTGLPALAVTSGGLSVAVPALLLTWWTFDGAWPDTLPARAAWSIAYLALFGSVLGFVWYFYLLKMVDAVKVNLLTLVTPVTALLLGSLLNGEVIVPGVWYGTVLILSGIALHQLHHVIRNRRAG